MFFSLEAVIFVSQDLDLKFAYPRHTLLSFFNLFVLKGPIVIVTR